MAQSILNKLDIINENSFKAKGSNFMTVKNNFEKIFDSKREDIKEDLTLDGNRNKESLKNNETQELDTEDTKDTEYAEELVNKIDDKSIDNTEEDIEEDSNQEANETITIKEENMQKELSTLENPTAVLLFSTKIQSNLKNISENEQQEYSDEETFTSDFGDKANLFKNFEPQKNVKEIELSSREKIPVKTQNTKLSETIKEDIVQELNIESINSECANDASSNDLMQNQSPQEQVAKIMIQGDVKYESSLSETIKLSQSKITESASSKIIEQISKQLDGMYNSSKLNIVLNPGTLGKINLQLINSKDGLLAQFTVANQEVKDALLRGLDGLKESLLSQGINFDNISVELKENSDDDNSSDWTEQDGSRGGFKQQGSKKQKENEKPFEQMMFELNNSDKVV